MLVNNAGFARLANPEQLDVDAYTVPARETFVWPKKPVFVLREVAAWEPFAPG